jgi:hypothetical protein
VIDARQSIVHARRGELDAALREAAEIADPTDYLTLWVSLT